MVTTDFYSLAIGFALAFLTVVGCLAILLGWFLWLETKLRRAQTGHGRPALGLPLIAGRTWGVADQTPPSTSAADRAEVDQLEELWRLPARPPITPR